MKVIVPLLSTVVSFLFATVVFDQYLDRRRPYQLVWSVGLLIYAGATAAEFAFWALGPSIIAYKLWYILGAILGAAYLGMGNLYLLAPRRTAHAIMIILVASSLVALAIGTQAPVDRETLDGLSKLRGDAMPQYLRLMTPFFNVFGTIALVGGALWSAWTAWRGNAPRYRFWATLLIAIGAFVIAGGETIGRLFTPDFRHLTDFLGITVVFIGFLRSSEVFGLHRFPLIHAFRRAS